MGIVTTLRIDIQHNSIECHYAECRDYLNVIVSVVMLSVIRLNVVMLSVVAPQNEYQDRSARVTDVLRLAVGRGKVLATVLGQGHDRGQDGGQKERKSQKTNFHFFSSKTKMATSLAFIYSAFLLVL
jgi:hypothetical protein